MTSNYRESRAKGHGLKVTWNFLDHQRPRTGRLVGLDHLLDHYHLIHEPHEGASLKKNPSGLEVVFDTVILTLQNKDLLKADRKNLSRMGMGMGNDVSNPEFDCYFGGAIYIEP